MIQIAFLALGLIALGIDTGRAQDIVGIEDCTKTTGLDRRTGCLQSNVNFLQGLANKNALETAQKLKTTEAEIAALKGALTSLQKAIEQVAGNLTAAGVDNKTLAQLAEDGNYVFKRIFPAGPTRNLMCKALNIGKIIQISSTSQQLFTTHSQGSLLARMLF